MNNCDLFPLTLTQQDIYFDQLKNLQSPHYNVGGYIRIGSLNTQRLIQAHKQLIQSETVFGLQVVSSAQGVHQYVVEQRNTDLPIVDFSAEIEPQNAATRWLNALFEAPLNPSGITEQPLFKAYLLKLDDKTAWYVGFAHHLIMDGWGFANWARQLGVIYHQIADGHQVVAPGLQQTQWQQIVQQDQLYQQSEKYQKDRHYWQDQPLQTDKLLTPHYRHLFTGQSVIPGGREILTLCDEQSTALADMAKTHSLAVPHILLAVVACYFAAVSDRSRLVLGLPLHNRKNHQQKQMLGVFTSVSPMVIDVEPKTSFITLVQTLAKSQRDNLRHQRFPIGEIIRGLDGQGQQDDLYDIGFNYLKLDSQLSFEQQPADLVYLSHNHEPTPLMITAWEYGDNQNLEIQLDYNQAYFHATEVQQLAERLAYMLSQVSHQVDICAADLQLVPDSEYQRLVNNLLQPCPATDASQATAQSIQGSATQLHQRFETHAAQHAQNIALIFDQQEFSYGWLNTQANQLAHYLREQGVVADTLVGICVERSPQMVVAMLATLKAGGAYVPLDLSYPLDRLNYMLDDANIGFLLSDHDVSNMLTLPAKVQCICLDNQALWQQYSSANLTGHGTNASNLAYMIYTSGSTGKPKGVMIEHGNVVNFFNGLDEIFGIDNQQQVWLALTSINFDISVLELFWTLSQGHQLVLQPGRPVPVNHGGEMDFSLFYFAAEEANTQSNKYQLLLEGAKFADNHQLSAVWIPERHFASFGDQFPNPAVAAAAVAAVTQNITLRSGSVVLPLHDPIRVAEEWSMVDNLSEGRVELSFASGWHPNDFVLAPADYPRRQQKMEEKLSMVQALWQGEGLTRTNGAGKDIVIQLHPKPKQSTLPIWITAAGNPDTFRYAGTIGANLLTHMLGQDQTELKEKIEIYRHALVKAGYARDHGKVALMLHTFIGETDDSVKATVEQPFKDYLRSSVNLINPLAQEQNLDLDKDADTLINMAFERYYHSSGLFGTPQGCLEQVQQLLRLGVNEIACLIDFGVDHQTTLAHLPFIGQLQQKAAKLAAQQRVLARRLNHNWSLPKLINQHKVTHLQSTPSYIRELVTEPDGQQALKQLKRLLIGGEALTPALATSLLKLMPSELYNMYGPTETTIWSAVAKVTDKHNSIGKPVLNTQCYVVNPQQQLVPQGVVGELVIGGQGVARGYFQRDALNAEKFIDNTLVSGATDKVYQTGDLVRWLPTGELAFISRADNQIKIRGHRVEPGEIESALLACNNVACNNVASNMLDTAVVVARDEPMRLVAYVVKKAQAGEDLNDTQLTGLLTAAVARFLPDYMVPAAIVVLPALPLTANGKIDRKALPAPTRTLSKTALVAAQTDTEKALVTIWAKLLTMDPTTISVLANFFELGGHSILAVRLIGEIRAELGVELAVEVIFAAPDIRAQAARIEQGSTTLLRRAVTAIPRHQEVEQLSYAQQRIWFIDRMGDGSPQYNMPAAFRVTGDFNVAAATEAFSRIIRRHESLRTTFIEQGSGPVQKIQSTVEFNLDIHDLTGLDRDTRENQLAELIHHDSQHPFALDQDLMIRAGYIYLSDTLGQQEGVLLFNMHHIASDGWSMGVLVNTFVEQYQAVCRDEADLQPAPEIQYADYAHWQRQWLEGEVLQNQLDYWHHQLEDAPAVHGLPLDYPRPEVKAYAGGKVTGSLSPALSRQLEQVAKSHNITLFMLLNAALALVLSRHSHSHDIVIGTPVANRLQAELEPLIGFFVNTLVLRLNTDFDDFEDYLAHIRQTNLDAQANQELPFEYLVEHCRVPRSVQYSPLFQIMFTMDVNELNDLRLPGLRFTREHSRENTVKFDLDIHAQANGNGIELLWIYDLSLFSQQRVDNLHQHFCRLLTHIAQAAAPQMNDMPMLSPVEVEQLTAIRAVEPQYTPQQQPLACHQLFEQQCTLTPQAIAVKDDKQQLSYAELESRANQLAHYLRNKGIGRGALVGVCTGRNINMVVAIVAVLKTGAGYLPLDQQTPAVRLQYMLEDSEASLFIVDNDYTKRPEVNNIEQLNLDAHQHELQQLPQQPVVLERPVSRDDTCYVVYTSGSTGHPKGVTMPHRVLVNLVATMTEHCALLGEPLSMLQYASAGFDMCYTDIFVTLASGGSLRLINKTVQQDLHQLLNLLAEEQIARLNLPYAVLQQLAFMVSQQGSGLPALKVVISTAEQLRVTNEIRDFFSAHPQCQLVNHYGPSETHVVSALVLPEPAEQWPDLPSIGDLLANVQGYILDSQGQLVPSGCVGQLYIGEFAIADGYLNHAELSRQKFVPNPYIQGQRLYNTGDLVRRLDNGQLEYLGRADDQVKINGFRIEPREVEAQLSDLQQVASCVVMVREDRPGFKQLVAYVVKSNDGSIEDGEITLPDGELEQNLRQALKPYLPDYMLPSVFIFVDHWPLNANGKIDKKQLPTPNGDDLQNLFVAAESDNEKALVAIWAQLLKLDDQQISIDSNFFELGGHSLLAVNLVTEIKTVLQLDFALKQVFSLKTIRQISEEIDLMQYRQAAKAKIETVERLIEMEI